MTDNVKAIIADNSLISVNFILGLTFLFALLSLIFSILNLYFNSRLKEKQDIKKIIKEYLEIDNNSTNDIEWIVYERRIDK